MLVRGATANPRMAYFEKGSYSGAGSSIWSIPSYIETPPPTPKIGTATIRLPEVELLAVAKWMAIISLTLAQVDGDEQQQAIAGIDRRVDAYPRSWLRLLD